MEHGHYGLYSYVRTFIFFAETKSMCTFRKSYTYIGNTFYKYPNKPILIKLTIIVIIHMYCTSKYTMYLEVHVF